MSCITSSDVEHRKPLLPRHLLLQAARPSWKTRTSIGVKCAMTRRVAACKVLIDVDWLSRK